MRVRGLVFGKGMKEQGNGERVDSGFRFRLSDEGQVRLGGMTFSQAGQWSEAGGPSSPRESGSSDAGLRRASARPQSKSAAAFA